MRRAPTPQRAPNPQVPDTHWRHTKYVPKLPPETPPETPPEHMPIEPRPPRRLVERLPTPIDQIILRSFSWAWSVIPYTTYRFFIVPRDAEAFDCVIRFSDLAQIEGHNALIQARRDGTPPLPSMPSAHSVPVLGKLFDNEGGTRMRGVDIQLYLYGLVTIGGGIRSTVLDVLREHQVPMANDELVDDAVDAPPDDEMAEEDV